jgi:hypothetical protein
MLKLSGAWLCGLSPVPQGSGLSRLRSSCGLSSVPQGSGLSRLRSSDITVWRCVEDLPVIDSLHTPRKQLTGPPPPLKNPEETLYRQYSSQLIQQYTVPNRKAWFKAPFCVWHLTFVTPLVKKCDSSCNSNTGSRREGGDNTHHWLHRCAPFLRGIQDATL